MRATKAASTAYPPDLPHKPNQNPGAAVGIIFSEDAIDRVMRNLGGGADYAAGDGNAVDDLPP